MKTQPYTVSARSMSHDPEAVITITWGTNCISKNVKLSRMGNLIKQYPWMASAMPVLVTSVEGRHFLAPCLMVTRPEVAVALNDGTPVGDGRTYATRRQMAADVEKVNKALGLASLPLLQPEETKWMLSPATPITQPTPAPQAAQPSLEAQLADSPF